MPKKASQTSIRQSLVLTYVKWTSILSRPTELFLLFWPVLNVYYTQGDNSDEKNDYMLIVIMLLTYHGRFFITVFQVLAIVQMDRKLRLNMCRQEVKVSWYLAEGPF